MICDQRISFALMRTSPGGEINGKAGRIVRPPVLMRTSSKAASGLPRSADILEHENCQQEELKWVRRGSKTRKASCQVESGALLPLIEQGCRMRLPGAYERAVEQKKRKPARWVGVAS